MQTLPKNLADNPDTDDVQVEFIVLNYGRNPEQRNWILSDPQMQEEMKVGRLVYAETDAPEGFHHAHAKNMAHRLATGDVLVNVDADNFAGKGFAVKMAKLFQRDIDLVVGPSFMAIKAQVQYDNGAYGRIALSKDNFLTLGGYKQHFKGWGQEDADFLRRARMAGLEYKQFTDLEFAHVIPHSDEIRLANTGLSKSEQEIALKRISRSYNLSGITAVPGIMHAIKVFERLPAIAHVSLVANKGKYFGEGDVTLYVPEPVNSPLGPLETGRPELFNSISGVMAMISDRVSPDMISLKGRGVELE
ncbi:MAG: glycosyltransferase family A protein [Bdellovibrionales bacterium]